MTLRQNHYQAHYHLVLRQMVNSSRCSYDVHVYCSSVQENVVGSNGFDFGSNLFRILDSVISCLFMKRKTDRNKNNKEGNGKKDDVKYNNRTSKGFFHLLFWFDF